MNYYHRSASSGARARRQVLFVFTAWATLQSAVSTVHAQYVDWVRQWGTAADDSFWGASVDTSSGTVYAVGDTTGTTYGANKGFGDALMVKYDVSGNLLGGFQDGSANSDRFVAAAADGAGGLYVAGYSSGGTFGPPRVGTGDNVFGRISPASTWTWLQQSATDNVQTGGGQNTGLLLTTGYVTSAVAGPWFGGNDVLWQVRDSGGNIVVQRQFGAGSSESGNAAAIDSGGNYIIAGITDGTIGGPNAGGTDTFVAKYNSAGTQLWVKQLGSAGTDAATSVTTDPLGNVYVAGITDGAVGGPNAGSSDNFIAKFDPAGNQLWVKQFGSSAAEANPLVAYFLNAVWLSASTHGNMFGTNQGFRDVYAVRLNASNANVLWSTQLGTSGFEDAHAIAADTVLGKVYIAGNTTGSFGGPFAGLEDGFVISINAVPAVPEPATATFVYGGAAIVAMLRLRRRVVTPRVLP